MCKFCEKEDSNELLIKTEDWEIELTNYSIFNPCIEIYLDNRRGYEGTDVSIDLDINFCPMCGKDLQRIEDFDYILKNPTSVFKVSHALLKEDIQTSLIFSEELQLNMFMHLVAEIFPAKDISDILLYGKFYIQKS